MAENVWSALVRGCLAFAHSHAGRLTITAFKDTGSLVASLVDHSPPGTAKARLKQLKEDVEKTAEAAKPVIAAVEPEAKKAAKAVEKMAEEIGTDPFTFEAAGRAATELAYVFIALDGALAVIAKKIAEPEPDPVAREQLANDIRNIREPWVAPFRSLGADTTKGFNALCKTVLGMDNAGEQFAQRLAWSREGRRLALTLSSAGPFGLGKPSAAGVTPLNLDGVSVEAFFDYKTEAKIGLALRSHLRAGLRRDKLLNQIIPEQAPTADANSIAITLDSKDGLTFGEGPNRKVTLPVRFSYPGIEVRELSLARPVGPDENSGRIDLFVTVAGKVGETIGVVAEGGGLIIRWAGDQDAPVEVLPKPPVSAGVRIRTGLVEGGGYLRYIEERSEYGGVLDLKFAKVGVWAAGLISADPFSMVVAMGVRFIPKVELSFGFTLNAVGGLLAIDRRLDSRQLRKALREGALNQILFPDDPISTAPKMLDRLGALFPPHPGGFVVGPMLELGWGSQNSFVRAKLGVVLALPDPRIVVLGALKVIVPTPDAPERIADLNIEVAAEITPDYLWIGGSLINSKLGKAATLNGDMALFIRWNGGAAFELSAGGFYSKYTPQPEMADLRRLSVDFSPPVSWFKVRGEAYFALTSNSLQFGGKLLITAKVGPAEGKLWLGVEALFEWAPRLKFIFLVDTGLEVKAFGKTVVGVRLTGELSGMSPWRFEGRARTRILGIKIPIDIGPIEWGERDTTSLPALSPAQLAAEALSEPGAWKPRLPDGADTLVRLTDDTATPFLVHPLGGLEIKQLRLPLETDLDRWGSHPLTARRAHLANPQIGALPAAAVSHATDAFPPGQFRNLTEDQQTSRVHFETFPCGVRLDGAQGVTSGPAVSASYEWETVYPHHTFEPTVEGWSLGRIKAAAFRANASTTAKRTYANPYAPMPSSSSKPRFALAAPGLVQMHWREDLSPVADATEVMTTTEATARLSRYPVEQINRLQLVTVGGAE